jgi:DNA-binding CsgD family transcriptional regulator
LEANKTILIGSDKLSALAQILKFIKKVPDYNYISATGSNDILEMINIVSPRLVVLNFNNNQEMLKEICPVVEESKTPILCLLDSSENFYWSKYSIVFTQDINQILQKDRLSSVINSILLLQNKGDEESFQTKLFHDGSESLEKKKITPAYELELEQKVEVLKKVKYLIKDLYQEVDDPVKNRLLSIANIIKVSISDEKHWEDFKMQFNVTHRGFLNELICKHPNLTNRDLKYCCYLKIGMSNEDIRHILGINQESVSTHKYRLKIKLQLSKNQNLRRYINQLSEVPIVL